MTHQYPLEEVPEHLNSIISKVEQGEPVQLTRQGARVAIILSPTEYARLTRNQSGFGQALKTFRQEIIEEGIDIDPDEVFKDVRDRSLGREIHL